MVVRHGSVGMRHLFGMPAMARLRAGRRSEIRLVGDRNVPFEMLIIFGAGLLHHGMLDTPPTPHCGPGRMEGIRIVHRKDNLYEPTVLGHPPALDDMELFGVRRAEKIEECVLILSDRVDDQRIAL